MRGPALWAGGGSMTTERELSVMTRVEADTRLLRLEVLVRMQSETIEVLSRTVSRMNDTIIDLVAGMGG